MAVSAPPRAPPVLYLLPVLLLLCGGARAAGPIRYSVLEESGVGTALGNVARDLGLGVRELHERKFRMSSKTQLQYFEVNLATGAVQTKEIIDREPLCGSVSPCLLNLELVMDNPMEFHSLEVEIVDINDNAPAFPKSKHNFTIAETTLPGAHLLLEGAFDPDVGTNALCRYHLSHNDFFVVEAESTECRSKPIKLILTKSLDREQQAEHHLIITAVDGGTPKRSGTSQIIIYVRDANDNPPVFDKAVYTVKVPENAPLGSLLTKVNATDLDQGSNGEVVYSFVNQAVLSTKHVFSIDAESGEIRVQGLLDFEELKLHELHIQAQDKGFLPMEGHCKVLVEIVDLNDNAPEIEVTSVSSPVQEDAQPGMVIAIFTVTDLDSGANGEVRCKILNDLPFVIESKYANYYSLSSKGPLDRELISEYTVTVLATDGGTPPLSATSTIVVSVSDVNDNPPTFTQLFYVIGIPENNVPGTLVLQISALDPDMGDNARIRYSLIENTMDAVSTLSLFSVHTEAGGIYALQPFDYEKFQVLQFQVEARDCGSPSLSATVNVTVFIQDENDNPPTIFPVFPGSLGSADTVLVPRSANTGYMVTKVRAIDADSGHNAWLTYELHESHITTPFRIGFYTGEVNLKHQLGESYSERLELIITVKDHGTPPRTATTTLTVSLIENNPEVKPNYRHVDQEESNRTNLNSYLIISIAFISSIFIFCIILVVGLRFMKARKDSEKTVKPEFFSDEMGNGLSAQAQSHLYNLYLTARSSECDITSRNSTLTNRGAESNATGGGVSGDLMQSEISAQGYLAMPPLEKQRK